jgi:transcriptional regulator with XRE-family HTH domain
MASLREVRAQRVLSSRELAREAAVAPSTVYLIEAGRTLPRLSVVRRLVNVLGVDPDAVDEFRRAIDATKVAPRPSPSGRD